MKLSIFSVSSAILVKLETLKIEIRHKRGKVYSFVHFLALSSKNLISFRLRVSSLRFNFSNAITFQTGNNHDTLNIIDTPLYI